MIYIVAIILSFTVGCVNAYYYGPHEYNMEDKQDPDCWKSYGGQWGYCTKEYKHEQ